MGLELGLVCPRNNNVPFLFESAAANGIDLVLIHAPGETPPLHMPAVVRALELDVFSGPDAALEELEAGRLGLDGILTTREEAVPWTALAARRLGLPGLDPEAALAARDKARMRAAFAAAGLNVPGHATLPPGAPAELPEGMSYPVVVKPTGGYASQGVIRVDEADDLAAAIDRVRAINAAGLDQFTGTDGGGSWGAVIVEEYIDGPEYAVDVFAAGGRTHVLSIGYKGEPKGPYFEETVYLSPAPLSPETFEAVAQQVAGGMEALGLADGPGHCELRLRDGGRPYLLEIGARIGGSGVSHFIVQGSTGIDFAGLQLRQSAGQSLPELPTAAKPSAAAGNWVIPVGGHGELAGISGLEELRGHPETERILVFLEPGAHVLPYPDFSGYPGFVLSRHADWQAGVDYHRWLGETLRVHWTEVGA